MADGPTRSEFESLKNRIDKIESDVKKERRERESFKKNLRLFLQRLKSQLGFKF